MHLAVLIDEIRWLRYAVYHAQGGKPAKPAQYPRPGVIPAGARRISDAARDYLIELRTRLRPDQSPPQAPPVPDHIASAAAKKLGPAERAWLTEQLAQLRRT
jgi:hypothetical protein